MELSQLSDDKLVVMVQSVHEQAAYSELVSRHQAALHAFLVQYTNDKFLAQDICQETLIKGYTKIGQFKGDCSFKTWLFSIAFKEFLQFRRKMFSLTKLKKIFSHSLESEISEDLESNIDLMQALETLGPNEKAAVLLNKACGLSHAEVAKAMGLPLGSVKTYINRGKTELLRKMEVIK